MQTELTALERQSDAFALLRNHARNAHVAGDGLLIGVLCHTGLDRLRELAKKGELLLPLAEIAWLPILALYWLVAPSQRHSVRQTFNELIPQSDEDRLVRQWIERYVVLIEQPLAGDHGLTPSLKEFAWPSSFAKRTPEVAAILAHMVELAWFQAPNGKQWKELVETWLRTAPSWSHHPLSELKTRLELQARLTAPDRMEELLPESAAPKLSACDPLAELWLLHLHGRSAAVCNAVDRLAPLFSSESQRWRVLHDLIHFNSKYESGEDSQSVRLARRRRPSIETPLVIFEDRRAERLTSTLCELFRARSEGSAAMRWDAYLLARLLELSALRLWDYGMWVEAIRAQALTSLDVLQWTDNHPEMSEQGLVLSVRSGSVGSPEKDAVVRRAVDILEFAPQEVLSRLGSSLLASYPKQKHAALVLLGDLTDILPPETWPDLARWTIAYTQDVSEERTNGWQLAPVTHWHWVLPTLPKESPVWAILVPEVIMTARLSHCWTGEYGAFLQRWLLFAPLQCACAVAEVVASHPETESRECFDRALLLIEFEEWNPHIHGVYTRRLLLVPHSSSEALVLAKHLNEGNITAREEALRNAVAKNVRDAIAQSTSSGDEIGFRFSPSLGVHLVSHWRREDEPLLTELIAAVNSENVFTECLPWLLTTIQLIVANGPVEFSRLAKGYVDEWTRNLPKGQKATPGDRGPLSIVQMQGPSEGDIALALGWLAFQLPGKLGVESHDVVLTWVRKMVLMADIRPLDMAIYGSALVAMQAPAEVSVEAFALFETAILGLSIRSDHDTRALESLARALGKVAALIGSEVFSVMLGTSPSSGDAFVSILSRFIPRFATSPHPSLRAAVAALVWQLKTHSREETWVAELLESLRQDRRARVRFETQGGWREARARAKANTVATSS